MPQKMMKNVETRTAKNTKCVCLSLYPTCSGCRSKEDTSSCSPLSLHLPHHLHLLRQPGEDVAAARAATNTLYTYTSLSSLITSTN